MTGGPSGDEPVGGKKGQRPVPPRHIQFRRGAQIRLSGSRRAPEVNGVRRRRIGDARGQSLIAEICHAVVEQVIDPKNGRGISA